MTIQGIMQGFSDPDKTDKNIVLVGRGETYDLIINGLVQERIEDLEAAFTLFKEKAKASAGLNWKKVTGLSSPNVRV